MLRLRFLVKGWYDWVAMPTTSEVEKIADEVLHGLLAATILAAGAFVKNKQSKVDAAKLLNLANELLPLVDASLGQAPAAPPAV